MTSLFRHTSTNQIGVSNNEYLGTNPVADLTAEMNALTFAERQAMEEDIHGVADVIEETPEFVTKKIEEMQESLTKLDSVQRQALDRAFFLRPALSEDRRFHLLCLRARQFRPDDAAVLMAKHFKAKRDLFGDDLLVHRITWNDLTAEEQATYRSGVCRLLPKRDRRGRSIAVLRVSRLDLSGKMKSFARFFWYVRSAVADDAMMQRNGVVWIVLDREEWMSSLFQVASVVKVCQLNAMPIRNICTHCIVSSASRDMLAQGFRRIFPRRELRMRFRTHVGSWIETDYALKTFGIDVSDVLSRHSDKPTEDDESLEADIHERQRLDDEWRKSVAPFREPTSPIALFPNPQDIIMGRNKAVAKTWSGNVTFHRLIQDHVNRYVAAQVSGASRTDKTLIAVEILQILQNEHKARFLAREETRWVAVDDGEARKKITQALRALSRERGALLWPFTVF